jgi:hypothetical protein
MKRTVALVIVAVVVVAVAVTGGLAVAWAHLPPTRMVRVGGMGNACTCTQRIEP